MREQLLDPTGDGDQGTNAGTGHMRAHNREHHGQCTDGSDGERPRCPGWHCVSDEASRRRGSHDIFGKRPPRAGNVGPESPRQDLERRS